VQRPSAPTLAYGIVFLEREVAIWREFLEGYEALKPPGAIAEVHQLLGDAFAPLIAAAGALAAFAATAYSMMSS
jgi:hypothetical protein